jgi:low temperature requirement protein LtrA
LFGGANGWRMSPSHFAERHGLIFIIALGEAIVSVGVGADGQPLDAARVVVAITAIGLAAAGWWLYFDVVALAAERALTQRHGRARNELARDSYSYLHFFMIAGIILLALAFKKTAVEPGKPLSTLLTTALSGGAALYLAAHVAFRYRNLRTVNVQRTVTLVVLVAAIPLLRRVDAVVAGVLVTLGLIALVTYEAIHFAENRRRIRHAHHEAG